MIPMHYFPFQALQVYIYYDFLWPSFFCKMYASQQKDITCLYPQHCEPIHSGPYQSEMVPNLESLNSPRRGNVLQKVMDSKAALGC